MFFGSLLFLFFISPSFSLISGLFSFRPSSLPSFQDFRFIFWASSSLSCPLAFLCCRAFFASNIFLLSEFFNILSSIIVLHFFPSFSGLSSHHFCIWDFIYFLHFWIVFHHRLSCFPIPSFHMVAGIITFWQTSSCWG